MVSFTALAVSPEKGNNLRWITSAPPAGRGWKYDAAPRPILHRKSYAPSVAQLRAELQTVLTQLLEQSASSGEVSLDAIGDAIGVRAVSTEEVDALLQSLEDAGRAVVGASDLRGEASLRAVVTSIRSLSGSLGRRPNTAEIAEHSGLSPERVRHALFLARIMQR